MNRILQHKQIPYLSIHKFYPDIMSKYILITLIFVALLTSCNSDQLVSKGGTDYVIYLSDPDNVHHARAVSFFQKYIEKMTGVVMPIDSNSIEVPERSVFIGGDNSLDPDGFELSREGESLIISGGSHKGCIYGVVHLLEHEWGIRMYSPDFEIVPEYKKLGLPTVDVKDEPVNKYRIINGRFCNDLDYQDWQRLDVVNDQFARNYYVHTFNRLVPWEDNFDSHPEYYSEVDGRRIKDQLCLTNPDVLKISIEKLKSEMAKQPDKLLWSVSQNDNFTYCQCPECRKIIDQEGSPAGPVIHFVNAIAREFPDKIISTLAYQYSRSAPKVTKPEPNVQVMLCTIELNRSQPIAEDPRSKSFLKDIVDWGKIANHIYLWDYTVNFSHHISPFPNYHVLQPNIQLFTNNNVHEHFQQSNTDIGHEFSELKSYLLSRLLWNPDVNVDSLILDFTDGYYGAAAPLVREYFDGLQTDILETAEWLDIYGHPTAYENTFLAEEKVNDYLKIFKEAREIVSDDSARLMHVREAQLPLQYAAMEIGKNHMFESRGWYDLDGENYVPRDNMVDMLEDFISTCRMIGVNSVTESGLKPEDYYSATKRFIDVQVEGNLAFRKFVSADPLPVSKYSGGDISYLTNGVQGASDYKVHWLGWEAQDFSIVLDLGEAVKADSIMIGSLYDPKSWILHPSSVSCSVSGDGSGYKLIGKQDVTGDQRTEPVIRTYVFVAPESGIRYVKLAVKGTIRNPRWHPSAGGKSWVFIDEIVVR